MRITKRVVNQKKHTVGYIVDGDIYVTRGQAVKLVKANGLTGYYIAKAATGKRYIASTPFHRVNTLYNLPEVEQTVVQNDPNVYAY